MNYVGNYYNLFSNEQTTVPPQFSNLNNYIMRFETVLPYYGYNDNSLTVIYFNKGAGNLVINNKKFKIGNNKFVISNPDRNWEYFNDNEETIDVLSFVFCSDLIEKFNFSFLSSERQLLDTPFEKTEQEFSFIEQVFNINHFQSGRLLKRIYNFSNTDEYSLTNPQELTFELLRGIYKDQYKAHAVAQNIKAIKKSTKLETLKRLLLAYEYIQDNLNKSISIKELCLIAGLSEYHLYSSFKNVFGSTPHQYINHHKMLRAKELLKVREFSVSEVAFILNYPDLPSFSKLFKKVHGVSPTKFISSQF